MLRAEVTHYKALFVPTIAMGGYENSHYFCIDAVKSTMASARRATEALSGRCLDKIQGNHAMHILVVGGAGYIGSHMVKRLGELGCDVTTLDNLSSGHREAVTYGRFVYGDIADRSLLDELFRRGRFDAVMHFASFIQVGESVQEPARYYRNNFVNTLNLLDAMRAFKVEKIIFSSTAATYGQPLYSPINEMHPQQPINPYGRSKLMVEGALADFDRAYGLKSVCLRYLNVTGADPDGQLGQGNYHQPNCVQLLLQVAQGQRSHFTVFGRDYETPDGTSIRDYTHVSDVCEANWLALQSLTKGDDSQTYNLGNGNGYSVQAMIDTVREVTDREIKVIDGPRRKGEPARLVADTSLITRRLGWKPKFQDLKTIIQHSWNWERRADGSEYGPAFGLRRRMA